MPKHLPSVTIILVFGLLAGLCFVSTGRATPKTTKDAGQIVQPIQPPAWMKPDNFKYVMEGRPDPFVPFIEPKVATKINPDEIVEEKGNLTGMQQFEPGQLTLVAVLFTDGKKMAMVEDVTGKGYILNKGDLIGRHGVVSRIDKRRVVITETAHTRAGKAIISTIVMRLNPEGDQ